MAVSQSVRFEILRRDKFRCRYCGKSPSDGETQLIIRYLERAELPSETLHVDHVVPVAAGGSDDPLNLVTACLACNLGKSDRRLSADSIMEKAHDQLALREQKRQDLLEMMRWKRELEGYKSERLGLFVQHFEALVEHKISITERGKQKLRTLLNNRSGWTDEDILNAMSTAVEQYVKVDNDGNIEHESAETAFGKIRGILKFKDKPWMRDLFYTRGILRNTCSYVPSDIMDLLEDAYCQGVEIRALQAAAKRSTSWTGGAGFKWELEQLIEDAQTPIASSPQEPTSSAVAEAVPADDVVRKSDGYRGRLVLLSDSTEELLRDVTHLLGAFPRSTVDTCLNWAASESDSLRGFLADLLSQGCDLGTCRGLNDLGPINGLLADDDANGRHFLYLAPGHKLNHLFFPPLAFEDVRTLTSELGCPDVPERFGSVGGYFEGMNRLSAVSVIVRDLVANVFAEQKISDAGERAKELGRFYSPSQLLEVLGFFYYPQTLTPQDETQPAEDSVKRRSFGWTDVQGALANLVFVCREQLIMSDEVERYMALYEGYHGSFVAVLRSGRALTERSVSNWDEYLACLDERGAGDDR